MSIYNRYIEDNHEIIEVVDYKKSYKSYVMYIYNKKYKLICDDYYQLLFEYKCENMSSGEIFKRIIPKEYLKYYPDYYKYQDEDLEKEETPKDEYDEEDYEEDEEDTYYSTSLSEHSNVRINTNYNFMFSNQKEKYVHQQQKLKQKQISDQIKYK